MPEPSLPIAGNEWFMPQVRDWHSTRGEKDPDDRKAPPRWSDIGLDNPETLAALIKSMFLNDPSAYSNYMMDVYALPGRPPSTPRGVPPQMSQPSPSPTPLPSVGRWTGDQLTALEQRQKEIEELEKEVGYR